MATMPSGIHIQNAARQPNASTSGPARPTPMRPPTRGAGLVAAEHPGPGRHRVVVGDQRDRRPGCWPRRRRRARRSDEQERSSVGASALSPMHTVQITMAMASSSPALPPVGEDAHRDRRRRRRRAPWPRSSAPSTVSLAPKSSLMPSRAWASDSRSPCSTTIDDDEGDQREGAVALDRCPARPPPPHRSRPATVEPDVRVSERQACQERRCQRGGSWTPSTRRRDRGPVRGVQPRHGHGGGHQPLPGLRRPARPGPGGRDRPRLRHVVGGMPTLYTADQLRRGAGGAARRRAVLLDRLRRGDGRGDGPHHPGDGRARAPRLPLAHPAGVHPQGDGARGRPSSSSRSSTS